MKFAVLALLATVSAVRISAEAEGPKRCVSLKDSDPVFDKIDTNGNGEVDAKELETAVKAFLEAHKKIHVTKKEIHEFAEVTKKDAGKDHTLNKKEFNKLANQVAHH